MKVKELIDALSQFDGDRDVYIWDHEYWEWRDFNYYKIVTNEAERLPLGVSIDNDGIGFR